MTDVHDRGPDTYAWKTAPAHLKTRRQLRAAGLAPGGHAPVAYTEHTRFGRRQITYLYDSRVAVPKRTASPAQLLAVAKAIREHQARAAERHGIDRAELDREHDPAPGWDHNPESPTEEENTMSDTTPTQAQGTETIRDRAMRLEAALAQAHRDIDAAAERNEDRSTLAEASRNVMRAEDDLEEHLRRHRTVLGSDPRYREHYAGIDWADEYTPQPDTGGPADLVTRIRAAYAELTAGAASYSERTVGLADLQEQAGLSQAAMDQALRELAQADDVHIRGEADQKTLTDRDRRAAVVLGGTARHTLFIEMPDTHEPATEPTNLEVQQVRAETFDIQSQMQAREDAYERGDITWDEYQSWEFDYGPLDPAAANEPPAPVGHGQRIAFLLATVAVNQARTYLDKLDDAVEQAERKGTDAVGRLEARMLAAVEAAEARLAANTADQGPASVAPLADALAFSSGSDIAAERLDHLIGAYRSDWGVRIDAMSLTVDIDPEFDAVTRQRFAEVERVFDRKAAAVDIVSALPLDGTAKAAVGQAIDAWHTSIDLDSQRWLDAEPVARRQLDADLAAAKVSDADRARVGFVVDFLRGDVSEVDLLASPVFVDPGEEARSRVPELLDRFARNPRTAQEVGREISVMTAADQERVRAAGKAIAEGKPVDPELWPGYVHRQSIAEDLEDYARDIEELCLDADYLAEGRMSQEERATLGHKSAASYDETAGRIDRLVQARDKLMDTARNGKGLASIERAHLAAVITDIDNGRIGSDELPELLFADEHSKADADYLRRDHAADQLVTDTREAITQRIAATNAVEPNSRAACQLDQAVKDVTYTLGTVANGTRAFSIEQKRTEFADQRGRLGQALAQAGVPTPARGEIREVLDAHARKAGELGSTSVARTEQWEDKVAQVAAARDDAAAQRQAAAAGRATPSEVARQGQAQQRACTARIDTSLATGHAPAPAGIRQLHSQGQEIGR